MRRETQDTTGGERTRQKLRVGEKTPSHPQCRLPCTSSPFSTTTLPHTAACNSTQRLDWESPTQYNLEIRLRVANTVQLY